MTGKPLAKDASQSRHGSAAALVNLLVIVSLAIAAGRIAVVTSREGDTAFQSANDRSRWATVASLVEHGTYAIDKQIAITDPIKRHLHPWQTIDKVRHTGRDGKLHYYSSKPPLFPTMIAGIYLVLHWVTGMTMTDQPIYLTRILLALVNLPMLALFLWGTVRSMQRLVHDPWATVAGAACVCFGTMMLPFTISLNNHLAAAASTAVVMWIYVVAVCQAPAGASVRIRQPIALIAGAAAAFAVVNELPALSMMVFWCLLFGWLDRRSLIGFLAGIALVTIGFFGTNWIAHHSLRPPYAHRGNGDVIAQLPTGTSDPTDAALQRDVADLLRDRQGVPQTTTLQLTPSDEPGRWIVAADETLFALVRVDDRWQLRHWDDWYEYPGSYWRDGVRRGVDTGEPSRWVYAFHMTLGHYGIFSLTPIWLLLPIGFVLTLRYPVGAIQRLAAAILISSLVCVAFYISRPLIDRNYGGVSVCFRWLLWFAPLWLLMFATLLQRWADDRRGRATLWGLLALSVFSMSTALSSPWQSPWLYQFWQFLGWIEA